jgi:protein TonB
MPRDIFSDVAHPHRADPRAWYTLPLSILAHVGFVAAVVVIPLMASDVLPTPASRLPDWVPVATPRPPDPPPVPRPRQPTTNATAAVDPTLAPTTAGEKIAPEEVRELPSVPGVEGGYSGPPRGGEVGGVILGTTMLPSPPPPAEQKPVRAGGIIKFPQKVHDVRPVYPQIAIAARVEGRVFIEAIIATDGSVRDARVIGSKPLLDQAALDAVRKWRFTPSYLNGVPVPVILTVTVEFTLR